MRRNYRSYSLRKPDELLRLFTFIEKDIAEFATLAFHYAKGTIVDALTEESEEPGFILEDQWGDIENISVNTVKFINDYLIEVAEDRALFTVDAEVSMPKSLSITWTLRTETPTLEILWLLKRLRKR